ncbi:MAG: type III pantothenate kinase [Sinomicrobium sp.]|nr:type III pantothenate kinase [Sinomicrobium sp.]
MNVIIDIGNTHVKLAVFDGDAIVFQKRVTVATLEEELTALYDRYLPENAIVSNVARLSQTLIGNISAGRSVHLLSHTSRIPFKNRYATPETLGVDRMALAAAAANRFPGKNALVIDAGTCITYDFLSAGNEYSGGAISPGVHMRYKALHTFTGNLPLLQPGDFSDVTGNSTESCIHSGILNGIRNEIEGVIAQYKAKYKDLTVILTGGDAQFLSKRLKNSIFVDPNFLMEGLNVVLEHNRN